MLPTADDVDWAAGDLPSQPDWQVTKNTVVMIKVSASTLREFLQAGMEDSRVARGSLATKLGRVSVQTS